MGKLFGTDGVRGIVSSELDISLAMKIGVSTARVLKKEKENITLLVGSDTRISKDMLKYSLISGVLSENANIIDLGVIPTPAISYLIKKYHVDGGFVISASHNPSEYNGIKIFNSEGFKLDDEKELAIEEIILHDFMPNKDVNKIGTYSYEYNAINDYVAFLMSTISTIDVDLTGLKIGIDTANGASFQTAHLLFDKLNVDYKIINDEPDGYNINVNAGSTHLEGLKKFVLENHLDCGIAFDGDADRCLMIDELGNVIDGDQILAIYSNYLKNKNELKNNTLVGTVMSNLGLVKFCEKEKIKFLTTKVGDRYVLEEMLDKDAVIGGENSGHIIFREFANTGDGELTAIQMLKIMQETGQKLSELASIMDIYPQVLKNVSVSKEGKENYQDNPKIKEIILKSTEELNDEGRILVRASGTENIIRVMLEGKDLAKIQNICDKIVAVIDKELN